MFLLSNYISIFNRHLPFCLDDFTEFSQKHLPASNIAAKIPEKRHNIIFYSLHKNYLCLMGLVTLVGAYVSVLYYYFIFITLINQEVRESIHMSSLLSVLNAKNQSFSSCTMCYVGVRIYLNRREKS